MAEKYILDGILMHIPEALNRNRFLLKGKLTINYKEQPGTETLGLRLVDPARVEPVVAALPRVTSAVAEWNQGETTGVLWLKLAPPQNATEASADANHGGMERSIRVKDLLRDISQDKSITQSRTTARPSGNEPDRGTLSRSVEPPQRSRGMER